MNFTAVDVETANADMSSICQIGAASFADGELIDQWKTLIDPKAHFDWFNIGIHGIRPEAVAGAPTFSDIHAELCSRLGQRVIVTHTHFDRVALHQASAKAALPQIECKWLDTARVARRTWEEFSWSGYGLENICDKTGYKFKHHDALEDAKAAGNILLAACKETGFDLERWLSRVSEPIDSSRISSGKAIKREGNPDSPLYGEVIVFTGTLQITRSEAADLASKVGCSVAQGVTKKTTLLCVGDQDLDKLAGHSISSKHRKADGLIEKGQSIRIIRESDFVEMVGLA